LKVKLGFNKFLLHPNAGQVSGKRRVYRSKIISQDLKNYTFRVGDSCVVINDPSSKYAMLEPMPLLPVVNVTFCCF